MRKCDANTTESAFVYVTDCNLATVADMAMKKSKRKTGEFKRQVDIAQFQVDHIVGSHIDPDTTRAKDVIEKYNGSVQAWAEHYMQD